MSFDGFFTYHMNQELEQHIVGGRINKIHQPSDYELVLTLRSNRKNYKLVLNVHPMQSRYHLTEETFFNPEIAPNFCMVLRKYLEGATIKSIQQVGLDRITTFCFQAYDELGDNHTYHLTIELTGRHSNIFLIHPQSNVIIDCLKHISTTKNSYRSIRPNAYYQLPPYQSKVNFMALSSTEIHALCQATDNITIQSIQEKWQGIGKTTAQWIMSHMNSQQCSLAETLIRLKSEPTCPTLLANDFLPITSPGQSVDTLSQLLDYYYANKAKAERIKQLSGNLMAQMHQLIAKNTRKLEKLYREKQLAEQADLLKIKGELLTTYAFQIEKSSSQVTLPNYYSNEEPLQITLDPKLNANQNAQAYFKKYQKAKQSLQFVTTQIALTNQENLYLESVLVQIQLADTEDLVAIREELISTGYLKNQQKMKRKSEVKKLNPLQFKASDGTLIWVGRNNLQNDQLTLKTAKKSDIWLHAKDIPGSHVIIQSSQPSQETLELGALLAAYYSKYQQASNVPVDYVAVKQVKKPNGAKPGFVIYENQKTLYVTPSPTIVEQHKI